MGEQTELLSISRIGVVTRDKNECFFCPCIFPTFSVPAYPASLFFCVQNYKLHGCTLFYRSFQLPHPLAGHTVSEDDFNQRYVGPVLAHSGINIVLFIQDKVCLVQ